MTPGTPVLKVGSFSGADWQALTGGAQIWFKCCRTRPFNWGVYGMATRENSRMADARDVIYAAIHSAFVKYPKEDDPSSHDHWIGPEEASHLTKVVITELEFPDRQKD